MAITLVTPEKHWAGKVNDFQREQREDRRIDFQLCSRIFAESWASSHIPDSRRDAFVKRFDPHVKTLLPFWARPASRFLTLFAFEFFNKNFGRSDWVKQALKETK